MISISILSEYAHQISDDTGWILAIHGQVETIQLDEFLYVGPLTIHGNCCHLEISEAFGLTYKLAGDRTLHTLLFIFSVHVVLETKEVRVWRRWGCHLRPIVIRN